MNPERWKKIDEIFEAVMDMPGGERNAYLQTACGTDSQLKVDVLNLIQSDRNSDSFLEESAVNVLVSKFEDEHTTFADVPAGSRIATYEIIRSLGSGGMGEVYLALDTKLDRKVALKLLPREFTFDPERKIRFETEARAISALNHPNIVTIHDFGTENEVTYIATEYVEGKTVRQLIEEDISIQDRISIITQVADALVSAHAAGIIHRDIKPENIMVRPDGYVKVLDFGLAKLASSDDHNSFEKIETVIGTVMGTPAYMSPAQASGEKVDHRTDLWSIGVVLYEMVLRSNPFKKENVQTTLKAILSEDPERPSLVDPEIPGSLDGIISKALEKDSDLRYQTASDLIADLKRLNRELDSSLSNSADAVALRTPALGLSSVARFAVFLGISALAAGSIWYFLSRASNQINDKNWALAQNTRLTNADGNEIFPSLAPDGESYVFAARSSDSYDIFLSRIGGKKTINLTENSGKDDIQPAFSPDGKLIAFRSEREGGGIFVMEETGENPRRVVNFGFHPSWSPDGKSIAVSDVGYSRPTTRGRSSIWVVNVANGEKRKLAGDFAYQPNWSPDGKRIAYWFMQDGGRRDIATISVESGEITPVTKTASTNWNPVWSPDGSHLYFASNLKGNMALWRIRIDQSTGKILSEAETVPTPGKFNSHISFSQDGKRLIYVQMNTRSNLKSVGFEPRLEKVIGDPKWITKGDQEIQRPRLSPDGKQFAINIARQTQDDIVLIDRDGKNWRDLTNDKYYDRYPIWSPDGKEIAFLSDRNGPMQVWLMNSDGSNVRQLSPDRTAAGVPTWAPTEKRIAFALDGEHYLIDFTDSGKTPLTKLRSVDFASINHWDWSPDGKKLAGRWRAKDGEGGVGYFSLETNEYVKVWVGEGTMPSWLPDSRRLIFSRDRKIHIFDIMSNRLDEIHSLADSDIEGVGLSRDGRLLYYIVGETESDVWLLDLRQ